MAESFPYLAKHHWLVFDDQSLTPPLTADEALAYQDSFIRWLPTQQTNATGIIHFYPIEAPTILLGAKDTRLADWRNGSQFLSEQGYQLSLRSHGGLAVVCDEGILNIGMASDLTQFPLSIDDAYEQMVQLIRLTLAPLGLHVEAHEIADSYCPGTYDLVINGTKIGGIAQRRFKSGLTTAAYISICGDQQTRAHLIRNYYQVGHADRSYPNINPQAMISLSDLLSIPLNVADFKRLLLATIQQYATLSVGDYANEELQTIFAKMFAVATKRSQTIQPDYEKE
ncbi:hypothetical protein NHG23_01300 [Aerococcaceae bacterium NML190073]|nr:hypothetical protein [Aerococcaceae bacterium NML190073]